MFNRILLAVDGSATSMKAAEITRELLYNGEAKEISVVYVAPFVTEANSYYILSGPAEKEAVRLMVGEAADRVLSHIKLLLPPQPHVEYRIEFGNPAVEIINVAEEGYDMIIIGRKGLNTMSRLWMGSVCNAVVQTAPCPVLVVKND